MPQVPYDPVPQEQAEDLRYGEPRVEAAPAAFGVNIGQGIQRVGEAGVQGGEKVFQTGMWLADLDNKNAARDAQNQYAIQSSQLHAKFGALTGKEAADALPQYLKDQSELRARLGSGLNPMARKMYDADSMPFMQRNLFSAAGHGAEQNKKYGEDVWGARADLDIKGGGDDPYRDPEGRRKDIANSVTHYTASRLGVPQSEWATNPIIKDAVSKAISHYEYNRLQQFVNMAKMDEAEKIFHEGRLRDDDVVRAGSLLEGKATSLYATNMVDNAFRKHLKEDGTWDEQPTVMEDELKAQARKHPDLQRLEDTALGNFRAAYNQQQWALQQNEKQVNKKLNDFVIKNNIMNTDEFSSTPGAEDILRLMPVSERQKLGDKINVIQGSIHKTTNAPMMTTIRGTRNADQEKFLNIDPWDPKLNLSNKDIDQVLQWQLEDSKTPYDDSRVRRAMVTLSGAFGAQMEDLGLVKGNQFNEDDYHHFTGALQEALTEWRENTGHAATEQEIQDKLAPMLFQSHMVSHWWRTGTEDPLYQQWTRPLPKDIPEAWKKDTAARVVAGGGDPPTEMQLYHQYVREQFEKLYGKVK